MLSRSGVINTDLLTRSQRGCYDFASPINNVRSCTKGETYRSLLAPDDNRLAGLICTYRAGLVSCGRCCFCCGRRFRRRSSFFGRGRTGLCKRQRRNQSADQSNDCSFQCHASFLISLPPQFVTQGSGGRSSWLISSPGWYCGDSKYLRFRRFEWAW